VGSWFGVIAVMSHDAGVEELEGHSVNVDTSVKFSHTHGRSCREVI